ncbi:MAG TPA: diguanylate cyclase [Porticoccaceae bacterium]|nr:diguanylate cyclase [Porticoccaceae bacterium]
MGNELQQIKVNVSDLAAGMYVARLDRPWSETPFPLQGFHIRSPQDIATLRTYCSHVYIDVSKGRGAVDTDASPLPGDRRRVERYSVNGVHDRRRASRVKFGGSSDAPVSPITVRKGVYTRSVPLRAEAEKARDIALEIKTNLSVVTRQIARGKLVDHDKLKQNVDAMVDSVLRCPDAFTWLIRLREKDAYTHDHSLRSALWAVQFARYIGLDKEEIAILCMGVLLKDIGKIKVPNAILRKQDRSEEEEEEYRKFVIYGVDMLRNARQIEPRVISIVRYHTERHQGQGFPAGVSGVKIPLLARIAGIAATYDQISNPRETDDPVAPSRAVSLLYNMRGVEFQEDLVVQFIQSVGLYPCGTLVELTTGDIGVVVEQHPESRLSPQVAVLDQAAEDPSQSAYLVDLIDEAKARSTIAKRRREDLGSVERIAIARDLEPTGYDVDMASISSLFMKVENKRRNRLWSGLRRGFQ